MAMVFSDGVWYDPKDRLFKMWYMGGHGPRNLLRHLEGRPPLGEADAGREEGHQHRPARRRATRPPSGSTSRRRTRSGASSSSAPGTTKASRPAGLTVYFSADGIHWGEPVARSGPSGDRTTVFYNPFRKVWVYSLRTRAGSGPRRARYVGDADVLTGAAVERGRRAAAVGRRRPARPAARRPQGAAAALQPRLRRLREPAARACSPIWRGQPHRTGRSRTRSAPASAATASTGTGPTAGRSSRSRRSKATGTGATSSRRAAAAWSSATSCTSTSAAGPA